MNKTEVLRELKKLGTARNRKVFGRHGVTGALYGVSCADLGTLKKKIKVDHELARELWASGNHDARVLAMMVGDPERVTARQLDTWVRELGDYVLTDAFSGLAGRSPLAPKRMEKWMAARGEWVCATGWNLLCGLAMSDREVPDERLEGYVKVIESTIDTRPNRARYAMNNALIAIGTRNRRLEKHAVAAARRIGPVQVNHGETGCRTPDAVTYIPRAAAHRRGKSAKAKAR